MRITSADLRLARDTRCFIKGIEKYDTPQAMYDFAVAELKRMGYKLVRKKSLIKNWKLKRYTTTWPRRIALGLNWDSKTLIEKAVLLMHELLHALQDRIYGNFYRRYVFDKGFRFAMEAQAYRWGCRIFKILGASDKAVWNMAKDKANGLRRYFPRAWRADVQREGQRIMAMA